MPLETTILKIIEDKHSSKILRGLLYCLSLLYGAGVFLRNLAYDLRWLKSTRAPAVVISVGNITAGGTGKTPLIHLLAKELLPLGSVAILSRGYRSKIERSGKIVKIDSMFSSEECGDEPYWLAKKLPEVAVWVGKRRSLSALTAKTKWILLDDGMQHRLLARDIEIVVMDGSNPLGYGYFLPRGLLRDSTRRLKQASLIVLSHVHDAKQYAMLKEQLSSYTTAPVAAMTLRLNNSAKIAGKKVGLFCGIGRPQHFIHSVEELGAEIVDTLISPDHLLPSAESLNTFAEKCRAKGAELLVCTEKDAVKLPDHSSLPLPLQPLSATLEWTFGEENWTKLKSSISSRSYCVEKASPPNDTEKIQ